MGAPDLAMATFSIRPGAPFKCSSASNTLVGSPPSPIAKPAATRALEAWNSPAIFTPVKMNGVALSAYRDQFQPACFGGIDKGLRMRRVGIDHRHAAILHHFGEQPEL